MPGKPHPLIYIVDDDNDDAEILCKLFAEQCPSCQISYFENGLLVMNALEANPDSLPSLILLDLNMPLMNGWEVLAKLKTDLRFKSIPTVVFTTSSSETDIHSSYQLGSNAYMVKPSRYSAYPQLVQRTTHFWMNISQLPFL